MSEIFYLDTCIWLNLFKKEGDETKGVPYWKIAKNFIERTGKKNEKIIVSTIVLKELQFKLNEKFSFVREFFKDSSSIKIIETTNEDYEQARKFESADGYTLSFYDYLHVAIAKRINAVFITRDRDLLSFSKKYIRVHKPEELLR